MDYRRLNKQTIKNNYPLPLITDLVDSMGNKRAFTKIDLQWDYNNMRMKEGDEWKMAFITYVVKNGHPSNSGKWLLTLSQSRQKKLVKLSLIGLATYTQICVYKYLPNYFYSVHSF